LTQFVVVKSKIDFVIDEIVDVCFGSISREHKYEEIQGIPALREAVEL